MKTTTTSQVDALVLTIHSAALGADGWTRIVNELSQVLSAEAASLVKPTDRAMVKPFCHLFERDTSYVRDYMEHWAAHDCWYQGALRHRRIGVGMVNLDTQLIDPGDFERTPFFNDYLRKFDIKRMMNVCLAAPDRQEGTGPVALSFYRGLRKDSFSATECALLSHLAPHLMVAAQNYWAAQSLRLLASVRGNALDSVTSAVFAVDRPGRLIFANRLGIELLRKNQWVRLANGALLPLPASLGAEQFKINLQRASSGIGSSLLMTDPSTQAQAQVSIAPVPADLDLGFLIDAPASLVWVIPTDARRDTAQDMARLFGLTSAERRILDHLIAGEDLSEATATLRVSIHTARAQLKSIFRKTGRRSQGQLLMLAARLATISSARV